MSEDTRWKTPTLKGYILGKHRQPRDTRDFLRFRLEEWMLRPALYLMNSQPEIPGHLGSLILLAFSVRQAAWWAGISVYEAVDLYGTWTHGNDIQTRLSNNIESLASCGKMHKSDEYCSDETMGTRLFDTSRGLHVVFHTLKLAEEMATIARDCTADIPFARLREVDQELERGLI